jgi:hypothetical protein
MEEKKTLKVNDFRSEAVRKAGSAYWGFHMVVTVLAAIGFLIGLLQKETTLIVVSAACIIAGAVGMMIGKTIEALTAVVFDSEVRTAMAREKYEIELESEEPITFPQEKREE